jgi:hypothetical protein
MNEASPTHQDAAETAPTPPHVKHPAKRAAGRKGGSNGRAVALIGIGGPLPTVELKTHQDRMAVLEAVLVAVAQGKTSGLTAQTLLAAVREARAESNAELELLVQQQARKIAELENGSRVIDVSRSR